MCTASEVNEQQTSKENRIILCLSLSLFFLLFYLSNHCCSRVSLSVTSVDRFDALFGSLFLRFIFCLIVSFGIFVELSLAEFALLIARQTLIYQSLEKNLKRQIRANEVFIDQCLAFFFLHSFSLSFFQNAWRMSTSTKSSAASEKATQTTLEQTTDDLTNLADARNQPLVIILAVTLPTLALIGLFIVLIVCYRRRHATIWLKEIGKSREVHCSIRFSSIQNIQVDYKRLLSIFLPRQSKLSQREFFCRHWTSFVSLVFQKRKSVFLIDLSVNHEQKPSSTID